MLSPPRGNTGRAPDYTFATTLAYATSGSQAGMLVSVTDPLNDQTRYAYDPTGRRTGLTDPLSHAWTFQYDNEDRLTQATAPAPGSGGAVLTTNAVFDPVGNRQSLTDANGQITRYLYDARDSLKEVDQSAAVSRPGERQLQDSDELSVRRPGESLARRSCQRQRGVRGGRRLRVRRPQSRAQGDSISAGRLASAFPINRPAGQPL